MLLSRAEKTECGRRGGGYERVVDEHRVRPGGCYLVTDALKKGMLGA